MWDNHKPSKTQRLFASMFLHKCQNTSFITILALRACWWLPHWLLKFFQVFAKFLLSSCAWITAFWRTFCCRSFCQEMMIGVQPRCHRLGVVGVVPSHPPVSSSSSPIWAIVEERRADNPRKRRGRREGIGGLIGGGLLILNDESVIMERPEQTLYTLQTNLSVMIQILNYCFFMTSLAWTDLLQYGLSQKSPTHGFCLPCALP